jgi:hypothetical protein
MAATLDDEGIIVRRPPAPIPATDVTSTKVKMSVRDQMEHKSIAFGSIIAL